MCKGVITYTAKYKSSRVKSDAFIVSFINLVIDNKITSDDITIRLMKLGHKKAVVVEEYFNGLIKTRHILLKGNYLRANIILGFIDNSIVRAKVRLITRTHPECAEYGELIMDFKLLKDFFIKDAKLLFAVEYDEMVSDTIYSNNLSSISKQRRDYKFNIPSYIVDSWINEIYIKQYQTDSNLVYNRIETPKDFVRLIKESRTEVITDLLFSPNYVTSIHAMEALLYLAAFNKVQLTKELNDRINQIKSGSFIIKLQGGLDVFYNMKGYKELQMTDEKVIAKYSSSM